MLIETALLITQSVLMLTLKNTVLLYILEAVMLAVMLLVNIKPIKELANLLIGKFLRRGKKN